jgi:hypothetical protein
MREDLIVIGTGENVRRVPMQFQKECEIRRVGLEIQETVRRFHRFSFIIVIF